MNPYKIPRIEIHPYPSNEYIIENQVQVFLAYIAGGCPPIASYVYRNNSNKIMIFLDGILLQSKFKSMKFVEKLCESITHEIVHSHVRQGYKKHFYDEEKFAKSFARRAKDPLPFSEDHKMDCKKCGKDTWWDVCPVCSMGDLL